MRFEYSEENSLEHAIGGAIAGLCSVFGVLGLLQSPGFTLIDEVGLDSFFINVPGEGRKKEVRFNAKKWDKGKVFGDKSE